MLAKIGVGGKVCIFTLAGADVLADVNGYVPAGGAVGTVVPARLLETRSGLSTVDGLFNGVGRQAAGATIELTVAGRGGVPVDAAAVLLNVTAVFPDGPGFATVWPCGTSRPDASNLNYSAGQVVPNAVLAKIGVGGKVCIFTLAGADVLADVNGYVAAAVEPLLAYEPFGWTTALEPDTFITADNRIEALSPNGQIALTVGLPNGGDPFYVVADRSNQSIRATAVLRPVGPAQDVAVIDNSGRFLVGPFGGPYTWFDGTTQSTFTDACAAPLGPEVLSVAIAAYSTMTESGYTYCDRDVSTLVNANVRSSGGRYLLRYDAGSPQIYDALTDIARALPQATFDWLQAAPSESCYVSVTMLDTGRIGKTVSCPQPMTPVAETTEFELRDPFAGTVLTQQENTPGIATLGWAVGWLRSGTGYYFVDQLQGDLIMVDTVRATRATFSPPNGCSSYSNASGVLWSNNDVCAN